MATLASQVSSHKVARRQEASAQSVKSGRLKKEKCFGCTAIPLVSITVVHFKQHFRCTEIKYKSKEENLKWGGID